MKICLKTPFLVFLLAACSPSEKKPEIETQTQKVEDSLQTEKPDGVKVNEPEITDSAKISPE